MPRWDSFSIRDDLRADYDAPVWVDNDVNLMALGELWRLKRTLTSFLVIKVGTGIGCGIVVDRRLYRGADGCAGDIGHIRLERTGPVCACGNVGCLEAFFGGAALARDAAAAARSGRSAVLAELLDQHGSLTAEHVESIRLGAPGDPADVARRVADSDEAVRTLALGPDHCHPDDISFAVDVDRFPFAMEVTADDLGLRLDRVAPD